MKNTRFDWHSWDARLYTTPAEINSALKSFGLVSKKIKDIHVIGMSRNMEKREYTRQLRQTLSKVGVPYQDIDSGKYPYLDKTLLPCQVELCEPVVFVFEDGSTFEIMPRSHDGLLLSVNQIDSHTLDGTNLHNFNSSKLFCRVIGSSIDSIQILTTKITSQSGSSDYCEIRSSVTYQIKLSGNFGVFFRQSWEGWFEFGLTDQHRFLDLGNETARTSFRAIKRAANGKQQIPIVEGHDGGGYFWIMPVKHVPVSEEAWQGIEEYRQEEISIDESDVSDFLSYFLYKYYDENYPYGDSRDQTCDNQFQWNLEYNIYPYSTLRTMLDDIEQCSRLLETDFDNPRLEELKSSFSVFSFVSDLPVTSDLASRQVKDAIIKEHIYVATEFYDRFVYRMRAMMAHARDYDLISFMGP